MQIVDVLVVGAGPAGSSAATDLAARGLDVVMIEKREEGWRKPCGGYLPSKTVSLLPKSLRPELLQQPIFGVRLSGKSGSSVVAKSHQPIGHMMRRNELDGYLRRNAEAVGVRIRTGEELRRFTRCRGYLEIETSRASYRAKYLIGADGVHSQTARVSGIRAGFPRYQQAFSLVAEIKWSQLPKNWFDQQINLYCEPVLGGMGWAFPLEGGANLGVAGSTYDLHRIKQSFQSLLEQIAREHGPYQMLWKRGWWLPAGGISRRLCGRNVLLVGDAAGLVDCFSGEGIYYAIRSGQLAAHSITSAFEDAWAVSRHYERDCKQLLVPSLRSSLQLSALLGRKKDWYRAALVTYPELASHLFTLMRAEQPYRGQMLALGSGVLRSWFSSGDLVPRQLEIWEATSQVFAQETPLSHLLEV